MMILIFYTGISDELSKAFISPLLNLLVGNGNWSVDLDDCDKVLRVEYSNDISDKIVHTLHACGFDCTPVPVVL
ncbi:hypothetical protein [Filimonas lacunae]|uniref:hypothetical protein n=1 Tax=Filimonas lacunae TaxID=477680 RepID=UPI0009714194|nr:hypothetical protein [Filimonas lacunae]